MLFQSASQFLPMIDEVHFLFFLLSKCKTSISFPPKLACGSTSDINSVVRYQKIIFQVYEILLEKMKTVPGAKVENNKFCLSLHFRCVDKKVPVNLPCNCWINRITKPTHTPKNFNCSVTIFKKKKNYSVFSLELGSIGGES